MDMATWDEQLFDTHNLLSMKLRACHHPALKCLVNLVYYSARVAAHHLLNYEVPSLFCVAGLRHDCAAAARYRISRRTEIEWLPQ
jgi:hypothetical protein